MIQLPPGYNEVQVAHVLRSAASQAQRVGHSFIEVLCVEGMYMVRAVDPRWVIVAGEA